MAQFGIDVTSDDVIDALTFFDGWEDRYKYIIDLGKELPVMDEALKTDETLVRGCQSQVWLSPSIDGGKIYFAADSDAFIVKGLLSVVLAALNAKTPAEILEFDVESYFSQLDLLSHLSSTRSNGLKSMVSKIQEFAKAAS
ncbi:MAG: SufE family protein [Cellvibrio sp.]